MSAGASLQQPRNGETLKGMLRLYVVLGVGGRFFSVV